MPSRVIRGEILSSDSLSRVSPEAEAFFFRLLLIADDFGRVDARRPLLLANAYPLRRSVTEDSIDRWLSELSSCDDEGNGPVQQYVVGGRPYLQLVNWEEHRGGGRRAEKSRFPGPDQGILGDPRKSNAIPGDPTGLGSEGRVASSEGRVASSEHEAPDGAPQGSGHGRLARMLGGTLSNGRPRFACSPTEKLLWCESFGDELVAHAELESGASSGRAYSAALKKITSARFRKYLNAPPSDDYQGMREFELEAFNLDAKESPCPSPTNADGILNGHARSAEDSSGPPEATAAGATDSKGPTRTYTVLGKNTRARSR